MTLHTTDSGEASECLSDNLTVLLLTYNEEANIARTLARLTWARHILVVDSGSSDNTLSLVAEAPHARVLTRPFDSFANQCNFGLTNVTTPWVLSLDADYELSASIVDEIARLRDEPGVVGYRASFTYRVCGHGLRATLYPPRVVLYRRAHAHYVNEGHGHRLRISGGAVRPLEGVIYHDDRKPLSRWFQSQQRYAKAEAEHLLAARKGSLGFVDRVRVMGWPAPILVFWYVLIVKRCALDGWPGWLYVLQRTLAETMIATEIVDRRLNARRNGAD